MPRVGARDVSCWGDNHRGTLGLGTASEGELRPIASPLLVGTLSMTLAGRHGLAILDSGNVVGWGDDATGLLGGGAGPKLVPVKIPALGNAREIASSSSAKARSGSRTVRA